MLIEFCCPVCQAPLSVKKKAAGGQVNCPQCMKVILIPDRSPLPREEEDIPPLQDERKVDVPELKTAIEISVEPYRRELNTKSGLLNDAVEMIKTRNQRIKEIESLILKTQKELWALEVEIDEERDNYKRLQHRLHEFRKEHANGTSHGTENGNGNGSSENGSSGQVGESDHNRLQMRLNNLTVHTQELQEILRNNLSDSKTIGSSIEQLSDLRSSLQKTGERLRAQGQELDETQSEFEKCGAEIQAFELALQRRKELQLQSEAEKSRIQSDMERLVSSSSEDIQFALNEKQQWKERAEELRAEKEADTRRIHELEARLESEQDMGEKVQKLELKLKEEKAFRAQVTQLEAQLAEEQQYRKRVQELESQLEAEQAFRVRVSELETELAGEQKLRETTLQDRNEWKQQYVHLQQELRSHLMQLQQHLDAAEQTTS